MKFPTMVYRCPGRHKAGHNQTYDYKGINSEEDLIAAQEKGWKITIEEAKEIYSLEKAAKPKEKTEYRKKLEEMANKLGIKFAHNTKDETLYSKIEEATKKAK